MVRYEMVERKPLPIYGVELDGRAACISKTGDTDRGLRWSLEEVGQPKRHFRSRREALYFFETGKKYKTNPVYSMKGGKAQKRIR